VTGGVLPGTNFDGTAVTCPPFTVAPISGQLTPAYSMSMTDEAPGLPRGDEASPAGLRASHADRDRVVELLQVAAGDGRLTAGELDERLEVALTARTCGELAALTTDLPAAPGSAAGAPGPEPKDLARIECHNSTATRDGRWLVPRRMEVRVTNGTVTLDFTEAVIAQPSLVIDADVSSGRLMLVTKPGVVVDTDDVAADNSYVKIRAPRGPDVPVMLRIQVSGKVGGGHITARPPRRTLWRWLRRHPPAGWTRALCGTGLRRERVHAKRPGGAGHRGDAAALTGTEEAPARQIRARTRGPLQRRQEPLSERTLSCQIERRRRPPALTIIAALCRTIVILVPLARQSFTRSV
jgi:Domain of unknown function (DUF1707)